MHTVRAARSSDFATFVRFFAELRIDDPVPDAAHFEQELAKDAFFVEDERGAAIGYGVVRVMDATGHVVHVVVDPEHRGKGVGQIVMDHAAARLREAGCTEWYLNVKPDNAPAIRLYERCGLRRRFQSAAVEIAWADVARLPREPAEARVLDATGAEDAAIEAALGLTRGQIASARGRAYVVIGLFDASKARGEEARALAIAAFLPSFPGAFPFRVARPSFAGTLLDAMRPYALPEHSAVRVVAEDDPALLDALRAAGAVTKLEFLQMRGAIPAA